MKKSIAAFLCFLSFGITQAADLPEWASPLAYEQIGSCDEGNLAFNAGRFSKINLQKVRDGLDVYLQMILFFTNDGTISIRTMEVGLVKCADTPNGEVCSYRPFPDTKKYSITTWQAGEQTLKVSGIGEIKKIRDDFPWLGYQLKTSEEFPVLEARNIEVIGGKVMVNFDNLGRNAASICSFL